MVSALILVAVPGTQAAEKNAFETWSPDSLKWQESRPGGTQRSILEGDLAASGGVVTYAFRMPPGSWFPPHTHPSTARVFVLKGELLLGEGEAEDHSKIRRIRAGEGVLVPGNVPHYEGSGGETIIIGVATSPFGTSFLEKH
jgi:quercetin dioxygenase-like cupin family protein